MSSGLTALGLDRLLDPAKLIQAEETINNAGGALPALNAYYTMGDFLSPMTPGIDLEGTFNIFAPAARLAAEKVPGLDASDIPTTYGDAKAQVTTLLQENGADASIIADDNISSVEFVNLIATSGVENLERLGIKLDDISEENPEHAAAFVKAREFAAARGIEIPEDAMARTSEQTILLQRLASFELGVERGIAHYKEHGRLPGVEVPAADGLEGQRVQPEAAPTPLG